MVQGEKVVKIEVDIARVSWGQTVSLHISGACLPAARWQESQLIKSNMFTEGENVWMEAGVEVTAPCWEKMTVTLLRINSGLLLGFALECLFECEQTILLIIKGCVCFYSLVRVESPHTSVETR